VEPLRTPRVRVRGFARAFAKSLYLLPAMLYPAVMAGVLLGAVHSRAPAFDFDTFRHAAWLALHGHNPYPPPQAAILRLQDQFVYPAPALALFAPLALIPGELTAYCVWALVSAAAIVLSAYLYGIRDWRVYALLMAYPIAYHALILGTVTPVLMLVVALLWRFRDRLWRAAALTAAAICVKLYLAPLLVWLAVTGRRGAAIWAAIGAAAACAVAWTAIGFAGLGSYPQVLSLLSQLEQRRGFSAVALYMSLGAPAGVAHVLALAQAAVMCGAALVVARRGDERGAFCLCVTAAMALSPIVWLDFYLLLVTPLCLYCKRIHPLWAMQFVFVVFPHDASYGVLWRLLLWNGVGAVLLAVGLSARVRKALRVDGAEGRRLRLLPVRSEERAEAA
jgi:Glycosyltransferase family 87